MKKITIESIDPKDQRIITEVGDYIEENNEWKIRINQMPKEESEALIAVHEMVEMILCHFWGIPFSDVDKFDKAYTGEGEPGDQTNCPYKEAHNFATGIERLLATALNMDWQEHEENCDERTRKNNRRLMSSEYLD